MNFIKLGDQEYPIQFGTMLLKKLGNKYKMKKVVEAEKLIGSIEWEDLDWIVEHGINNAAKVSSGEPGLSKGAIAEAIDMQLDVMPQVLQILTEQLTPEKEESEEEDEKKSKPEPAYKH